VAATAIEEWTDSLAYVLEQAIDRVPRDTSLLRLRIALAAYRREPTVLHDCLNRIVAADPSWATATFAAKHWRLVPPSDQQPGARVALLSSYTIDPLVPFLECELHRMGARPDIYLAPFNTWVREVMDPSARLRSFSANVVILAVSLDDLVPDLSGVMREGDLTSAGESALARIIDAAEQLTAWSDTVL